MPVKTSATPFQLCSLIGRIRTELHVNIEQELARQGFELGFSQFVALKRLGTEGPMTAGELARLLNHNPGALTRLLDKLERQNYLRRVPDPDDRRVLRIELTASGRTLWKRINACGERVAERALDRSTEKERAQLQSLLNRVLDNLRQPA
ncbi:MAG TPA: MarR family transcriptional regulator [Rhodanobacteraceae bacterium]|nr:MarR family transcriptional regulator [Rhodanobacteraceae bacterium]